MQKLTITHITNINTLMLNTISTYINTYNIANTYDTLIAQDVLHNSYALHKFNNTKNVQQLHNAIIAQDTLVREYFVAVLQYIENNNLIATSKFCCN
jgi:ABC-type uncharacterized transport system permease subunit